MRVLFVNRMASMVRGGGETFDVEIARHLQALGCEVSFLTGLPLFGKASIPFSDFKFQVSGFHVRTPYFGWFPWDSVKGGWRLRLLDFWLFEKRAAQWAWNHRHEFDVIQVCELPTFVSTWKKRKTKIPIVMRLTAPDYHDEAGAIHQADALIASGATLAIVRKDIRPDCHDIPNGVDVDLFRPHSTSWRDAHGISQDDFILLFVARFQRVKNHRMLLQAFTLFVKKHAHARLVLAGSGPLQSEIKSASEALGLAERVIFLGEVAFDKLPEVYASADAKVISSDYESFCFAALEAMATALPLIVTDTDWVPGLIERNRGGVVVPKGDAPAMAEAMEWMLAHDQERRSMGLWNRDKVQQKFTWADSAKKLKELYLDVIKKRDKDVLPTRGCY